MPPPGTQPRKPNAPSATTKEANEYIPSFISKKPFYIAGDDGDNDESSGGAANDYLEHQRLQKPPPQQQQQPTDLWYERGKKLGPAATKFRKGACENCGAMTHRTKECLSRPRARGARWTGRDIQADEAVQRVDLGWDAKRDRWNGYDAREYRGVVDEFAQLEALRRAAKAAERKQLAQQKRQPQQRADGADGGAAAAAAEEDGGGGGDDDGASASGDDEDAGAGGARYAEESDMGRHQSTATKQLRIREDTAKYLLNLDLDSARYDPKRRAMVDSGATRGDAAAALVAEEGFLRASGDAAEFERAQRYAWESQERATPNNADGQDGGGSGSALHLQANPTQGEFRRRVELEAAAAKREAQRRRLLERYGGGGGDSPSAATAAAAAAAATTTAAHPAAITASERFVEYDESGAVKGAAGTAAASRSRYREDVRVNNHAAVWGSWWADFAWGYACCRSRVKNSYCTGEEGRRAFEEAAAAAAGMRMAAGPREGGGEASAGAGAGAGDETHAAGSEQQLAETGPAERDRNGKGRRKAAEEAPPTAPPPLKKRAADDMHGGAVTEEDMEAYRRKRTAANDPMAAFLGKDELIS